MIVVSFRRLLEEDPEYLHAVPKSESADLLDRLAATDCFHGVIGFEFRAVGTSAVHG